MLFVREGDIKTNVDTVCLGGTSICRFHYTGTAARADQKTPGGVLKLFRPSRKFVG